MRYLHIITLCLLSTCVSSQDRALIKRTANLASEAFVIYESNPTQKPDSESITQLLHASLEKHIKHEDKSIDHNEINTTFDLLYHNSNSFYSDSPEERRMKLRRAACFASIALLSDLDRGFTFLEYARVSLAGHNTNLEIEFLEEPYLSLLLIDILFKYESNQSIDNELLVISSFIDENKENLSKEIIKGATVLIKDFQDAH